MKTYVKLAYKYVFDPDFTSEESPMLLVRQSRARRRTELCVSAKTNVRFMRIFRHKTDILYVTKFIYFFRRFMNQTSSRITANGAANRIASETRPPTIAIMPPTIRNTVVMIRSPITSSKSFQYHLFRSK